jgi:predicted nucleic acid-binding protein
VTAFIDTSALYALLDADDLQHQSAKRIWAALLNEATPLVTSNYVIIETTALIQNRLGMEAVRAFHQDVLPVIRLEWVNGATHQGGVTALLTVAQRQLSLVDCVSFELMRRLGIRRAFAFDEHFAEQGFDIIP